MNSRQGDLLGQNRNGLGGHHANWERKFDSKRTVEYMPPYRHKEAVSDGLNDVIRVQGLKAHPDMYTHRWHNLQRYSSPTGLEESMSSVHDFTYIR